MTPNLSYRKFTEGLKGTEISSIQSGYGEEGAKRLAFLLIWLKFQFGWRLGKWELSIPLIYRPWIYLGILIFLTGLVLIPALIERPKVVRQVSPVAISFPILPTDHGIAPDTLLNQFSLNPLCNDE